MTIENWAKKNLLQGTITLDSYKKHIPIRLGKVSGSILQTFHIQEHLLP